MLSVNSFFYSWLQQLQYVPTTEVPVAAVAYDRIGDTGQLMINEPVFAGYTLKQRMFILMHELMHWVYQHPFFSELGDEIFALAADAAINDSVKANPYVEFPEDGIDHQWMVQKGIESGFPTRPPGPKADTMAYYDWLKASIKESTNHAPAGTPMESGGQPGAPGPLGGGDVPDSACSRPPQAVGQSDPQREAGDDSQQAPSGVQQLLEEGRRHAAEHEHWHVYESPQTEQSALNRLAADLQEAKSRTDPQDFRKDCGSFAGNIEAIIKAAQTNEISWQHRLRQFVGYCGAVILRTTYGQMNKYGQTPKIKLLPGTKLCFLLDTSGSMSPGELAAGLAEVEALHKAGVEIEVIEFDHQVQTKNVRPFRRSGDYVIRGRGGTSFQAAFDWLSANWRHRRYTGAIVLTDGECYWPKPESIPDLKRTLWVITNSRYQAPAFCGETVHLNLNHAHRRRR